MHETHEETTRGRLHDYYRCPSLVPNLETDFGIARDFLPNQKPEATGLNAWQKAIAKWPSFITPRSGGQLAPQGHGIQLHSRLGLLLHRWQGQQYCSDHTLWSPRVHRLSQHDGYIEDEITTRELTCRMYNGEA